MSTSKAFTAFLNNIKVVNSGQINKRFGRITRQLNNFFYDLDSKNSNSLQVGSYGRYTGIKDISDLDMLFILPNECWDTYKENQSYLLQRVKDKLKENFKSTNIRGDGQVVVISFGNQDFEVCPVFQKEDGTFKYPDTNNGGKWKKCNPRDEIESFRELNATRKGHLRRLAKMMRVWRTHNEIQMSGFLVDTLCYNFFLENDDYDDKSYRSYDELIRDFFRFLEDEGEREFYYAFGSNSKIPVKAQFYKKVRKSREASENAVDEESFNAKMKEWKKIFGRKFPNSDFSKESASTSEMHIENLYEVKEKYQITIDCKLKDENLFEKMLSKIIGNSEKINKNVQLEFYLEESNVPHPFVLKWKVKNSGSEALKRNCIRGQIINDDGSHKIIERADFTGEHYVECYAIYQNEVVARDRIQVPIDIKNA